MRLITIFILILSKMSFAQYIQNEQKDKFFLELIQKSNNEKITTLFYNNNVNGIELWDSKKYEKTNKQIINKEQLDPSDSLRALEYISSNKKMKTIDSMIILNYLHSVDSIYFYNVLKLIDISKKGKIYAYDYSNPNIKYTNDSIILPYFTNKIPTEFAVKYPNKKTEDISTFSDEHFYKLFLEIERKKNKIIKVKLKGFIVYKTINDWDGYLGLAGICCYILNK